MHNSVIFIVPLSNSSVVSPSGSCFTEFGFGSFFTWSDGLTVFLVSSLLALVSLAFKGHYQIFQDDFFYTFVLVRFQQHIKNIIGKCMVHLHVSSELYYFHCARAHVSNPYKPNKRMSYSIFHLTVATSTAEVNPDRNKFVMFSFLGDYGTCSMHACIKEEKYVISKRWF